MFVRESNISVTSLTKIFLVISSDKDLLSTIKHLFANKTEHWSLEAIKQDVLNIIVKQTRINTYPLLKIHDV